MEYTPEEKYQIWFGGKLTRKHGLVQSRTPVESRDELEFVLGRTPVNRLHGTGVPAVDIAGGENDFGVRVSLDEFFGEGDGGPIAEGLAMAGELVPLFAAEGAFAVVLSGQGIGPHEAVRRVLDRGGHHVIAVIEANFLESGAQGSGTCAAETKGEHAHRDDATTFSTVDVGVGGEDVGDGFGGIWLEGHFCWSFLRRYSNEGEARKRFSGLFSNERLS